MNEYTAALEELADKACFCARDLDGKRLGEKCAHCLARLAVIANAAIALEIARLTEINAVLMEALETIAGFAPGNGDDCELIARRARAALKGAWALIKAEEAERKAKGDET